MVRLLPKEADFSVQRNDSSPFNVEGISCASDECCGLGCRQQDVRRPRHLDHLLVNTSTEV